MAALIALLMPFGAMAAELSAQTLPNPLYKKKLASVFAQERTLFGPKSIDAGSYVVTVYFAPPEDGQFSSQASGEATLLLPVVGATPIATLKNAGWIGSVRWSEQDSDGRISAAPHVFKAGASYTARIKWTLEPLAKRSSVREIQMPRGDYLEGRTAELQKNVISNDQNDAQRLNAPPSTGLTTEPFIKVAPASPLSATARQSILPDLGGEPEPEPEQPTKKPVDGLPAGGQPNPGTNASAMTPFGGSMPPTSGAPNGNGFPRTGAPAMTAPSVKLGDAGLGANVGLTGTNFYHESKNYLARVGVDYVSPKSSYGFGVKADGAALLGKTFAVGTNLTFNNINEAVLNGTWMPEGTNLKAKLSGAYMWGKQDFNFYSGNASASLTQASYYFSTQYVVPKEQSDYLHSAGISVWGSKASQVNNPTPVYTTVETTSSYNIMLDPLKLATGTLQGQSLDAQVGLTNQVIAKASMGYETLKFPFSDGSQELNKRLYQDYVVQYQPIPEVSLQAGYKMGAAMNNVMLSAAYSQWKLTGFKNNGNNGITGNQGLMVTYTLPFDGNAKSPALGTLMRPELIGNSAFILRDAAIRPVQLPQAFLAKVDTTAVTMAASISKSGLGPGVTVNQAGDVLVLVGVGNGVITGVTRNGAPYVYASTISPTAGGLMIKTLALPSALPSGDTYVVSITDSTNTPYLINFTTAN